MDVPQTVAATPPEDIVRQIVLEHPKNNGSEIKAMAKQFGLSKARVDAILQNGEYSVEPGRGAAKLYTLIEP